MNKYIKKITSILMIIFTCLTCGNIKITQAEEGYKLSENGVLNDLFELGELTPYHVGFLTVETPDGHTLAYCVEPKVMTHIGDTYEGTFDLEESLKTAAQVAMNYGFNYDWHELYGSTAGYYAAQIAVWGRLANPQIDPASLTIKSNLSVEQKELAEKVRTFASTLYNDHTTLNHGLNFKYNGSEPQSEYVLNEGTFDLYDIGNELYYRSEKMSVTTYGTAGNLSYTVSVDGGAYVTDGSEDLSAKKTSITLGGDNGNVFYVFVPADKQYGEINVNIKANYTFLNTMTWNFSSGPFGFGQRMISNYIDKTQENYSLKLIKKAREIKQEQETEYNGKINISKVGTGIVDYSTTTVGNNTVYSLAKGEKTLSNANIALLRETGKGYHEIVGDRIFKTVEGTTLGTKFALNEINKDGNTELSYVKVCEVKAPLGYELFDGVSEQLPTSGITAQCLQGNFREEDAINGIIEKNLKLVDKAKTFTVNVTKSDQDGNKLKDYEFGLFTTKEIKVAGKDAIPADSMVAYGKTDSNGQLKLVDNGYFLPADQNYVLRELNAGNEKTKISVDGTDSYGTEITLNTLEKATVDGYQFNINVVNEVYKTNNVKVIKVDKKTNEKLSGATFNLSDGRDIKSCTTGDDGSCTFENIPYGTYTLNEVIAPNGYVLNEEAKTVIVNATTTPITVANLKEANQTFTIKKVITNTPNTTDAFSYTITKVSGDETGYTSSVNAKAEAVEGTRKILANATDTYSLTFKKPGTYEFKVKENNEYYKQNETISTANTGKWEMDKTEYNIKFVVNENMAVTTTINGVENNAITLNNKYSLGSITLTKYDAKNDKVKLSGVEFELLKNGTSLGKKKTDASGQIIWNDLVYGTYQIKETATIDGYIKSDEIHEATINETTPNQTVGPTNYHEAEVNIKINKTLKNINGTSDKFDFVITNEANVNDINNKTFSIKGAGMYPTVMTFKKAGTYEYTIKEELTDNIKNVWKMNTQPQKIKIVVDNEMNVRLFVNNKEVQNQISLDFENELIIPTTTFEINKQYVYKNEKVDDEDVKNLISTFEVKEGENVVGISSITGNGSANSPELTFNNLNKKVYTVKENKLNNPKIKYDETVYTITVEPKYEGDGKFKFETKIKDKEEITFTNEILLNAIKVEMPITKVLEGESNDYLTFSFTSNNELIQTIKAKKGPIKIGYYKLLNEGEYEYKILEKNLNETGVTYDKSEYVANVKVERDGLKLKSTVTYTKDGKEADEIIFTNKYKKPEKPTTPVKDSCTSKGPDYFWGADGTCQRRATNTSTR